MLTKKERMLQRIAELPSAKKEINTNLYYTAEQFYNDCIRWVKAIEQGRMICNIYSVSKSGMSRQFKFIECSRDKHGYNYLNFFVFLRAMGEKMNRSNHTIVVSGCGMDMIFATNYNIMHRIKKLGIISEKQCTKLAQVGIASI